MIMKLLTTYFLCFIPIILCIEYDYRRVVVLSSTYFNDSALSVTNDTTVSPSASPSGISSISPSAILVEILVPPPPAPLHADDWFTRRGLSKETFAMATGLVFLAILGIACFSIFFADLIRIFRGRQQQQYSQNRPTSMSPLFAISTTPEENKRYSMVGSHYVEKPRGGKFEDEIGQAHHVDNMEEEGGGDNGQGRLLSVSSSSSPGRATNQSWTAFQ